MRPLGILGWILVVAGIVVLALGGFSYVKERNTAQVGPIEVGTVKKGFVPPVAGGVALVIGIVLVVADGRRTRT
ncbi:MAG TPA: hypothetical protein VJR24_02440 [Gemmatimonadaceae bacterium]|nr:hypothetical protein [Gemmatimonadaceae bacterium]